jgi:phenylacetate-CoA ligase
MSILDPRIETMPRAELEQFQFERLQALLVRLRRNVRRYRERLGDLRVESLEDLARLPLTSPEDLVAGFPYGLFAFPLREIIRLYSTTGAGGKPLVLGHTRNDLAQWGRLAARQLAAAGVTANDIIQISLGGGAQSAACGFLLGAELIEASVLAEDPLHIDRQLDILRHYHPTCIVTTPTNASQLVATLESRRIDPQSLQVRVLLLSRPVPAELREKLATGLFAAVLCNCGISEIIDPGLCVECEAGGFHVNEDQFLPEICSGELVITTLQREAMPLLRFRTGLAAELDHARCSCGRTGTLLRPGQHLDERVRFRETTFYREQIAEVLSRTAAANHPFRIETSADHLELAIEMSEALFARTVSSTEDPKDEIRSEILSRLGLGVDVRFVEPTKRRSVE